jgi:hypothetical protein
MSLSTLQLASTGAVVLLAGSGGAPHGPSLVLDEPALAYEHACPAFSGMSRKAGACAAASGDRPTSPPLNLKVVWKTRRTASDVLTDLLDVDGVRVVADRRTWDQPDTLALRHDFAAEIPVHLFCGAGIDRAVYLESHTSNPEVAQSVRRERSVGMMAEVGASLRLTGGLDVEAGLHWRELARDARLLRTEAGWVSGDPVTIAVSLVWRSK